MLREKEGRRNVVCNIELNKRWKWLYVLLGSMAHTFCCCRPVATFCVRYSRPRKPHRPQRLATMSSPTARPPAAHGWVGQCSNTSRWSVASGSVSGQGYGHGGHDDGLQALPRRGLKSRILHHSTNQGSDRAIQISIDLIIIINLNEIISHFPSFFFCFCWGLFLFEWSSWPTFSCFIPSALEIRFRVVLHQCIPHT